LFRKARPEGKIGPLIKKDTKFFFEPSPAMISKTCTAHTGAKKAHDWAVDQLADLFRTIEQKHNRWLNTTDNIVGTSN
jgi:hypothetical protein